MPMRLIAAFLLLLGLSASCSTIYYSAWEKLGREKRDLLRSNIESAKDDQTEVQEEFEDALTHIKHAYGMKGGKLEDVYNQIKSDYEDAKEKSANLSKRITRVDTIGKDLFDEWSAETKRISNPKYKRSSEEKLRTSKLRFATLMTALRASEKRIPPVLKKLEDQVLYLKHNLNAMTMGTFKAEGDAIEKEIRALTADMETSIKASESFVKTLEDSES